MLIKLNIQNQRELQALTAILVNRIIEESEFKITLDDPGIDRVLSRLEKRLIDKQAVEILIPNENLGYEIEDIIRVAKKLLEQQREPKGLWWYKRG